MNSQVQDTPTDIENRNQKALDRCKFLINYYDQNRRRDRLRFQVLQVSSIVLGGLTPILILWSDVPKPLQALPSALATIAASLLGIFQFHENWISYKTTAEALKGELLAFETRTTELYHSMLTPEKALENFIIRVDIVHKGQVSGWSERQMKHEMDATKSK